MKFLIESILYSYSQIYFNNRLWFGVILLILSFLNFELGLVSLIGVVLSNLTAFLLKFDKEKIRSGFYGFNGLLFGAATLFYYENNFSFLFLIPLFILLTFFISAALEHYLASNFNLPGLSLPFVLSIYIFIIFLTNFDFISPKSFLLVTPEIIQFFPNSILFYFKSLGLILFNTNVLAGFIIALAILYYSRIQFLLSLVSFYITYFIIINFIPNYTDSLIIISGFNSILTGIALGGALIIPSKKTLLIVLFSSILVIVFTLFFEKILKLYYLPVLVLPFNSLVFAALYSLKFRTDQSDIVLLYFSPGSPEENYYYHHNRKQRFDKLTYFFAELPFLGEWFVGQGHNGQHTHKNEWKDAFDFVIKDLDNTEFSNDGNELSDYFCYKIPVVATLEGSVVKIQDGIPNNEIGKSDIKNNWGNTIILDHGKGLFSSLSHLEPNSIKVKVGDNVKKGSVLALCGNSGRSPYPHLHLQFQKTDKIGENTLPYPVASFIERNDDNFILKTFDYPKENSSVQNLELHKSIKKAFDFTIGEKMIFDCKSDMEVFQEKWEIKIDIYNNLYIESDKKGILYFYITNKILYLTNFIGEKDSALYFFYLTATTVPLSFKCNLSWEESLPISKITKSSLIYLSEVFLFFKQFIKVTNKFNFYEDSESNHYVIHSKLNLKGEFPFNMVNKNFSGELSIDNDGNLIDINYQTDKQKFYAKKLKSLED